MALFNDSEQERIRKAIEEVEKYTTGELRVCVEKKCGEDVLLRAAKYFEELGMQHTRHRHGILIYVATVDRKFAIIGDKGINKVVPADFWDTTKDEMLAHFKIGDVVDGIVTGLKIAGNKLQLYFPHHRNDGPNELPNDIAFMDGN
ncbi:TLP18.3/Psb32/MOLO-1 phosphatase superfamily protein [Mucilaginibacter gracilis]|uniref:TLP18.3/Psb32/MOLO-1 phosphatase superfamily protein n=1 Tax=Mucilaginibacter gracilis TaxID=423350 RepID=A0A495J8J1_9SPHI|nr:TPM domain-containing protein [Mucilaginibacter gracilis]RKR85320.1 TLP18.3/Psb32/MOLO-1 phosphatase superfamily protein [Mucilaginibacter gracilis]